MSIIIVFKRFKMVFKVFWKIITNFLNYILLIPAYFVGVGLTSIFANISWKAFFRHEIIEG